MKKLAITTLVSFVLTLSAFAQGTVSWFASGSFLVGETNGTTASSFAGGGPTGFGSIGLTLPNTAANNAALGYQGYYYELLVSSSAVAAPSTFAEFAAWSDANLQATNNNSPNGRIVETGFGGAGGFTGNTEATASNWSASDTESIILVGWSANLGSTWTTVLANAQSLLYLSGLSSPAYWGVSAFGSAQANSGSPGVTIFGNGPGQINNPSSSPMVLEPLVVTPEPGTLALAVIGGASLFLFRRRK